MSKKRPSACAFARLDFITSKLSAGFKSERSGKRMTEASQQEITWTGTFTEAFQRVLDVIAMLHGELLDADPGHGTISARTGPLSLGPTITVTIHTVEGVNYVKVSAHPAAALLDWGASERLVARFVEEWGYLPLAPVN